MLFLKKRWKPLAFTLVELIVVITILAILGTIGLLSLQGYSKSARDSERTTDLTNIGKGFDVLSAAGKLFPQPDANMLTITASGTTIGYQGYAGKNVISALSLGGKFQDPTDTQYYTYSTNLAQNRYQILGLLEDGGNISLTMNDIPGIQIAYAGTYDTRYPLSRGASLGILLGTGATLNQPVQELYVAGSFTGVDIVNTTGTYTAWFGKGNLVSGTGGGLITAVTINNPDGKTLSKYDPSLVGYWDMETTTDSTKTKIKDLSGHSNDGQLSGTSEHTPQFMSGRIGQSLYFDGIGDYVEVLDQANLRLSNTFTIQGWVKKIGGSFGFISKDGVGSDTSWAYDVYAYDYNPTYETNNQYALGSSINNVWNVGDWNDIIVVLDSSKTPNMMIYSNGINTGSGTVILPSGAITSNLLFGRRGVGSFLQGNIDEVRIYNRALSASEISALYAATK